MRVHVLLSTYDGARFLAPQLRSVLDQTHADLRLVVRDDGSSDGTQQVLAEHALADPRLHWTAGPNLGAATSFLALLGQVDEAAELVAFCDQDDVWEPDHLARAVDALRGSASTPTLWCSDVLVCDAQLTPRGRHDRVRRGPSFRNALVQNVATGCTVVLNRAAVDLLAGRVPRDVVMHDAWCYLVVAALGRVVYDPTPSVRYRLHGANSMGLSAGALAVAGDRIRRAVRGRHVRAWSRQAGALQRLYGDELPAPVRAELEAFLDDRLRGRLRYAVTGGAVRQTRLGTVAVRVLHVLRRV